MKWMQMNFSGRSVEAASRVIEIDEVFEEDFPRALAPAAVHAMGTAFGETQLRALHAAIDSHDDATFRRAFAETAAQCNACHVLGERGMIHVPTTPGESVPIIAPEAAPAAAPAKPAAPPREQVLLEEIRDLLKNR